jgi:hypothetical protein
VVTGVPPDKISNLHLHEEITVNTERILDQIAALQAQLPDNYPDELTKYIRPAIMDEEFHTTSGRSGEGAGEAHNLNSTENKYTPDRTTSYLQLSDTTQRHDQDDLQQSLPLHIAPSSPSLISHYQASATSRAGDESSSSTLRLIDEPEEVTRDAEVDVPEGYANEGYETESHRKWREEVTAAMRTVSERDSGPKNGTDYQEGVDYVFKTFLKDWKKAYGVAMVSAPTGEKTTRQARTIAWIRRFSISTRCVDHQVEFDGHSWFLPVMLAAEMHDWNWLTELRACGLTFPSTNWMTLKDVRVATFLELASDWSLGHLKQLTEQFDEVDPVRAAQCRGTTIAKFVFSYNRRPEQLTNHAIQILLDTGDLIGDLGHALFRAVDTNNELMVGLLLQYRADPNYCYHGEGTTLHLVVRNQTWHFVKLLVSAGADPSRKAGLYTSEVGSSTRALTPIELAAREGRLERLNEELGTQYKDQRSSFAKRLSRKRQQLGGWQKTTLGTIVLGPTPYS